MSKKRTATDYIKDHVIWGRQMIRSAGYLNPVANVLRLSGKSVREFVDCVLRMDDDSLFDIRLLSDSEAVVREAGEPITIDDVFSSSTDLVWTDDVMMFRSSDGTLLTPSQYDDVREFDGLGKYQVFGNVERPGQSVYEVWRGITRRAREARNDTAVEIMYVTLGVLEWKAKKNGKKTPETLRSPLFLLPAREGNYSKNRYSFRVTATTARVNTLLQKDVNANYNIDIFSGCPDEVDIKDLPDRLHHISELIREYALSGLTVHEEVVRVALVNSGKESICQAVERDIKAIASSHLVKVFAEIEDYFPKEIRDNSGIFPLFADDDQRLAIRNALAGNSLYVNAPAGTGKSQTIVNIAANMALEGKRVLVLSEKSAANETFLKYAGEIKLNNFCLSLTPNISLSSIVRKIKTIMDTVPIRINFQKVLNAVDEAERVEHNLNEYQRAIYDIIPGCKYSLYELIGDAMSAERIVVPLLRDNTYAISVRHEHYYDVNKTLHSLQVYLDFLSPDTLRDILDGGDGGFELIDDLVYEMDNLTDLGVDIRAILRANEDLSIYEVERRVSSEVAYSLARSYIEKCKVDFRMTGGVKELGYLKSTRLLMWFKQLWAAKQNMTELAVAVMNQALNRRITEGKNNNKMIALLDNITNASMPIKDFFSQHGDDILRLCPIVVTTPATASGYIIDKMNSFDIVLVDEASQVLLLDILPYLRKNTQLIAFGDEKQLDTTVGFMKKDTDYYDETGSYDLEKYNRSVLQCISGKLHEVDLNYHYRSKTPHLVTVSNILCYNSRLKLVPDIYRSAADLPDMMGNKLVLCDNSDGGNNNRENEAEAEYIVDKICEIVRDYPEKSIGVVTFNKEQKDLIENNVRDLEDDELNERLEDENKMWIRALENAQGKEADIIFISICHNKHNLDGSINEAISNITGSGGDRRLNVMFTRARECNIITISFDYRELADAVNPNVRILYQYLDNAAGNTQRVEYKVIGGKGEDKLNSYLCSLFESRFDGVQGVSAIGVRPEMRVDIGLVRDGSREFDCGLISPSSRLSPNAIFTKIYSLVRSGWKLLPLSPISLIMDNPEALISFYNNNSGNDRRNAFVTYARENFYQTDRAGDMPAPYIRTLMNTLDGDVADIDETECCAISLHELKMMDFRRAYAPIGQAVNHFNFTREELQKSAKLKSYWASAVILMKYKLSQCRCVEDVEDLQSEVAGLYDDCRKVGYFLAQLYRVIDAETHRRMIAFLLKEAKETYMGGENND